ncbi:MAG: UDP-N-acetylglucosamine 2-epimerase (non-hydrolyzing) [Rhodothermales bacterium]|nr:UDP-N-acetylglucosamine 2-epimerase (non-hydrolyzing) [Rhodothermales bacterium]
MPLRRLITVVGARPQFVKAAMVSRALASAGISERLIHSGQHYDPGMSQVFFEELDVPRPDYYLEVGSGSHAAQTGRIMERLEEILRPLRSDLVVQVYGDTNTTLAAALVAAKLGHPIVHVEAGLRSFNRSMPEEINRLVTDRLSTLLCCPTENAVRHLAAEGMTEGVHLTGDVMYDATRHFAGRADERVDLSRLTDHGPGEYVVATVHRAENTDHPEVLKRIFAGLARLHVPVVMPLHPRTRARLADHAAPANVTLCEPLGYLAMLKLMSHARAVFTDSGGLQKEAFWLNVPCVTLRAETEWTETLEGGWNQLVGSDPDAIATAYSRIADAGKSLRHAFFAAPKESASRAVARLVGDLLAA